MAEGKEDLSELGFSIDEDQTENEFAPAEDWQAQFNHHLREGWLQGFTAKSNLDVAVDANPYTARDMDDLVIRTRALGWEDGWHAANDGRSADDCPYPAPAQLQ